MQQIGRYQVIERLGKGAMGVVYKALDPRIGRVVAIKSIRLAEISDASELKKLRDRLEREARSAGALSHRNIVAIYDILEEQKLVHLFMEYVNGPSLEKLLASGKLPDRDTLQGFLAQLASALDYAHKIGIVHRDVKPSNLLIQFEQATDEQIAKVTDFGVAKFISQQMTQAGSMMGTPNYMAPEQIEGAPITGKADQFALAAVAYELLCGEKPFVADYIPTLFFRIVREEPKNASALNPSLSADVNGALQRGLAKKPDDRFETCSAFVQTLADALGQSTEWRTPYSMEALVAPPSVKAEQGLGSMSTRAEPEAAAAVSSSVHAPETLYRVAEDRPSPPPLPMMPPVVESGPPHVEATAPSEESKPPQGPMILPYDLPYQLPELRRSRRDEEESAELPLWRKVAIVMLVCVMAAIVFAVYRNFRNSGDSEPTAPQAAAKQVDSTTENQAQQPVNAPAAAAKSEPAQLSQPTDQAKSAGQLSPAPVADKQDTKLKGESTAPKHERQTAHSRTEPRRETVSNVSVPVQFNSIPGGAHVVVDSDEALSCTTPCSLPLNAGRHTLTMVAPDFGISRRIFSVPDQKYVLVPLAGTAATVQLDSVPSGSTVYIDGQLQGQTPATLKLAPGPHKVKLISGNRAIEQTIDVTAESLQNFLFRWQ